MNPDTKDESTETAIVPTVQRMEELEKPQPILTLETLAMSEHGLEVPERLGELLTQYRRASIAQTDPEDWTLFKRPIESGGGITAYLNDVGCQRIEPIWGIQVIPCQGASKFESEVVHEGDDYAIILYGDGYCRLTDVRIYAAMGARRSDEDFVRDKTGIQKKVDVQTAAFRNLHGRIVRSLTGLGSVAVQTLDDVWKSSSQEKSSARCSLGKGYGSRDERLGLDKGDFGEAPDCPTCKTRMLLRPGKSGRSPFWGCPNYKTCGQKPINAKAVKKVEGELKPPETLPDYKNFLLDAIKTFPPSVAADFRQKIYKAETMDQLHEVEMTISERGAEPHQSTEKPT